MTWTLFFIALGLLGVALALACAVVNLDRELQAERGRAIRRRLYVAEGRGN